jgi:hypothetical protein
MRKLGVFAALVLSGMTACAERIVSPAAIPEPALSPTAAPKPRPDNVEARRQAEAIAEDARKRSAVRSRQAISNPSVKPEQRPETQAPLPQVSQQSRETPIWREPPVSAALPPPPEPAEPNVPVAALMLPPPEPAEPTFPSASPEPAGPTLPDVSPEAAMPPPLEPAEPSFPVAALMPPPPVPAEPSLPSQEEIAAENPISISFPDLPSYLSLRPRFDWVDTVGTIEVPRSPQPEALEDSAERQVPSLIRNPWPLLPTDAT